MKIRIQLEGRSLTATLDESEAARDFLSLLPLTLTLTEYHSTEKVADLPRKLSTTRTS
ncbi:MAG: cyclophilin-like fold protein [Anaeromyxobacteraceae bacterium]